MQSLPEMQPGIKLLSRVQLASSSRRAVPPPEQLRPISVMKAWSTTGSIDRWLILKAVARKRTAFWGEGCGCWQLLPRATIPRSSLGDNPIKAFLLLP